MVSKSLRTFFNYNYKFKGIYLATSHSLCISFRRDYNNSYMHHISATPLNFITLGQALTTAANQWPDRPAVISRGENRTITFSELIEEADKLAAGLQGLGMEAGDRLGIWAPNCTQWVVALLAAGRAGLVSVAINPLFKKREIDYCLKKVGVKALIAQERVNNDDYYKILTEVVPELRNSKPGDINCSKLKDLKSVILITDKDDQDIPGVITYKKLLEMPSKPEVGTISRKMDLLTPDDGCNIQFTSGTTGEPKAALLTHYGIVNNGYYIGKRNELCEGHRKICVQVPLFHVYGVVVTVSSAIQYGATMVFPSAKYNIKSNLESLIADKCDLIHGTPTMYVDLLNEIRAQGGVSGINAQIAVTGGSSITPQLVQDMAKYLNVKTVKSLYGMTEATAVNFQSIPGEAKDRPLHYVGYLHDHLEAKIVDEKNNLVPFGTPGELLIKGYSVMKGYWNDEVKTKETIDENGWLRTGDQVVLDEDGYSQIVGRLKDLIIRGGENIAPKEIEDIVSAHSDVIECQVFGVHDDRLGEEVFAAVRLKEGVNFDPHKLSRHCLKTLSKYKVPKAFKLVDSFPKTASGKVQKFKLRNMVESGQL